MKFRFCGDLDCPDWVLAEISVLSKLSSIRVKLLCAQVIKSLLNEDVDHEKILKMASDTKFELDDMKACMAVLTLIISNATKYGVDANSLSNELQQLGMPKEHASVICKFHEEKVETIREELLRRSLKSSKLVSIDWRVDYVAGSSLLNEVDEPFIRLKIVTKDPTSDKLDDASVSLTREKFLVLMTELKQAQKIMENL